MDLKATYKNTLSVLLVLLLVCVPTLIFATGDDKVDHSSISYYEVPLEGQFFSQFQFIGKDHEVVIVSTDQQSFRSTDGGASFSVLDLPGCHTVGCAVRTLSVSPADKATVYLISSATKSWVSLDSGYIFTAFDMPMDAGLPTFYPHPQNPAWALMYYAEPPNFPLFITKDYGKTWDKLFDNVLGAAWKTPKAEKYDENDVFVIRTVDSSNRFELFDTARTVVERYMEHADGLMVMDKFLFVVRNVVESDEISLFVSPDNGFSFKKSKFPQNLAQKSYTILDAGDDSVFVNVYHKEFDSEPWGDVFMSDASGSRFTLSMYQNRRRANSCDFHRFKGMPGVYIANTATTHTAPECRKCSTPEECATACQYVTKITFDKGSTWTTLPAPSVDATGTTSQKLCGSSDAKCNLHLHGLASVSRANLYSEEGSVGLILATGNIGPYLLTQGSSMNTYLSRDGGMTWEEIMKGSYIYKFMDHGGLITMIPKNVQTDKIFYSADQGKTWQSTNFTTSEQGVVVNDIHIGSDQQLLVEYTVDFRTRVSYVDFSGLFPSYCTGLEAPDSPTSDYEHFRPHGINSECLLGSKMQFTRRKRDSKCWNPAGFKELKVQIQTCTCDYSDYVCDIGYKRQVTPEGSAVCVKAKQVVESDSDPSNHYHDSYSKVMCDSSYYETKGYMKIPGNTCTGGLDLNPVSKPCTQASSFSFLSLFLLSVILALFFAFFFIYAYHNINKFQKFVIRNMPWLATKIEYLPLGMGGGSLDDMDDDDDDTFSDADEFSEHNFGKNKSNNIFDNSGLIEVEVDRTTLAPKSKSTF